MLLSVSQQAPASQQISPGQPSARLQFITLAGFLAFALILRAPTFSRSVLDWDESLYLLIANAWAFAGHLPYTTIWDNKPLGIYAIFAAALVIGGHHVAAIRAAAIIAVTLTAFASFRIAYALLVESAVRLSCALIAGIAYSIGALCNDGLAANTEIFMACFTALAMVVALSPGAPARIGFITGILFTAAILTKYVAIFEAPALALALFWWQPRRGRSRRFTAAIIGGFLPLAAIILLYGWQGQLGVWWQDSVISNLARAGAPLSAATLRYILNVQLTSWLPFYLITLIMLWPLRKRGRAQLFLLLWLAGGAIGVASAKLFFDHYFQQILPVLCVITAAVFSRLPRRALAPAFAIFIALPAYAGCNAIWQITWPLLNPTHQDIPEQITTELRAALQPGQSIYVFDDQPIIYFLLDATPPTKFVLPSTLTTNFLAYVAGVDAPTEVTRILASNPAYIVVNRFPPATPPNKNIAVYDIMRTALTTHYHLWKRYYSTEIYQINHRAE